MKKLINRHKKLVGAALVAPFCWRVFQTYLGGHPSFLLDIVAMAGLGVASGWFGYSFTRGYVVMAKSVVGWSRIKLEIKMILFQGTVLFAMFYYFMPTFVDQLPLWGKIFFPVGLTVAWYGVAFAWVRWISRASN